MDSAPRKRGFVNDYQGIKYATKAELRRLNRKAMARFNASVDESFIESLPEYYSDTGRLTRYPVVFAFDHNEREIRVGFSDGQGNQFYMDMDYPDFEGLAEFSLESEDE